MDAVIHAPLDEISLSHIDIKEKAIQLLVTLLTSKNYTAVRSAIGFIKPTLTALPSLVSSQERDSFFGWRTLRLKEI